MTPLRMILGAALALSIAACASTYYNTLEKVGIEKRELLVSRVAKAQDSQIEAQQEFTDALEQFRAVVAFDGGDLEDIYDRMSSRFEDTEAQADEVRDRIDAVENVAEALFDEWEGELEDYTSAELRRNSRQQLRDTQSRYNQLMRTMRRSEAALDPVLGQFRDQVLYLKHNLNAAAIGSLQDELPSIEREVDRLIRDMQQAIDESAAFIAQMSS